MSKLFYPSFRDILRNPTHFFAFGCGSGLIRPAPGTWGTLLGTILFLPFFALFSAILSFFLIYPIIVAVFLIASFAVGIYLCGKTAEDFGVHDHSGIVWDEFVGIWLVQLTIPHTFYEQWDIFYTFTAAFLLFRLFDIWKPTPIGWLDKNTKGGFGIMIDDIVAGIYASALLWGLSFIIFS